MKTINKTGLIRIRIYFLVIILILLGCNNQVENQNEDFVDFIIKFSFDESFQIERIMFPLKKYALDNTLNSEVKTKLQKTNWTHIQLINNKQTYITDIQSKCDLEEIYENEQIFALLGIETGIDVKYFFKNINGKWFLVKIEDYST